MIKATELRTGNYIYKDMGNGIHKLCIVDPLILKEADDNSTLYLPIGLAGRYIYKLGFDLYETETEKSYFRKGDFYIKRNEKVDGWILYRLKKDNGLIKIAKFNLIHELQNLYYSLKEVELTFTRDI